MQELIMAFPFLLVSPKSRKVVLVNEDDQHLVRLKKSLSLRQLL